MSDDLISRKAAVELVIAEYDRFQAKGGSHSGRYELDKVIKMIQNMPTALDKEKVKQELEISSKLYSLNDRDCEFSIPQNIALEIVEKGGIE